MSPWKVILATMVIFVCGVVTGALVIRTQGWRPSPPARPAGESGFGMPGSAPVQAIIRQMTQADLRLSHDQVEKIENIMQESQATNAAIRKTIAPLLEKEVDRAHQAITNCLTQEQQTKYAALLKEHDQRGGGRGDARGRRGGEGPGFPLWGPDRGGTNSFPDGSRGRMGRRGFTNNLFTNDAGNTNRVPTSGSQEAAVSRMDGHSPGNIPSTNAP